MAENVLQTLQQLVQDVIAPDVRELKVRLSSLEKQIDVRFGGVDIRFDSVDQRFASLEQSIDTRFDSVDQRFASLEQSIDTRFDAVDRRFDAVDQRFASLEQSMNTRFAAMEQRMDTQFNAIMAALGEFKAQSELNTMRVIASLSERVAVLESRSH